MTARKRVGIAPHLYCDPLRGRPGDPLPFGCETDQPARLSIALRERKLDLALLTPIDYARDGSFYHIVPGVGISSSEGTGAITLHFHTDLTAIRTLAVDPASSSEIILARVILGEQFDLRPQIVPVAGTPEEMLGKGDAALLVGDASLRFRTRDVQMIDLVEEWFEMTDLPYVHGVWCGRERSAGANELETFSRLRTAGVGALDAIAAAGGAGHGLPLAETELREILSGFEYSLTEEAIEGMTEFLRFAYYHGFLPDVADLHYFDPSAPGEPEGPEAAAPLR